MNYRKFKSVVYGGFMQEYSLKNERDKLLIVSLDLNASRFKRFEDVLNKLLEDGVKNIIISFKDVRYITSNAIGFILLVKKILVSRGGNIILTGLNEYLKWSLKACGAYKDLEISESISKAVAKIGA